MTLGIEKEVLTLISDKKKFQEFVYTPVDEAFRELHRRNENIVTDGMQYPEPFANGPKAVFFRHVATSNYETRRFISIVDGLGKLEPLILEYTTDKFTNQNEWKFHLGKIPFHKEIHKGGLQFENVNVIDFNVSNGKSISEVKTLWGQSLVDFHHELFFKVFPSLQNNIFDLSKWLHDNGQSAKHYYKSFLRIFIRHGILFENFLLEGSELSFTRDIVLPSLMELTAETTLKPLIVSLEPTETEGNKFWLCHPYEDKAFVVNKVRG